MERSREYHINNATVRIIFGNILDSDADVIANSSGSKLTMSGGLTKAIRKAGGEEILIDAQRKLPVKVGDTVVTTAGRLRQKYIFHCITLDKSLDHSHTPSSVTDQELHQYIIEHSVDKCFQFLHTMELTSIAFPSLGAGAARIPFKKVAETMAGVIAKNLRKTNRSMLVEIYLFDRFGEMTEWDYMPMFEQFAKQEGITELIKERAREDLLIDETHHKSENPHLPDPESELFISYSRKDSDIVRPIYEMHEKSGLKCWLDIEGMYSGVSFKKVIVDAIRKTTVVLFMSSSNSNRSRNVVSEISLAMEYGKSVLPVRLDMTPYAESIEYDLINHDYVAYDAERAEDSLDLLRKKILATLKINEHTQ